MAKTRFMENLKIKHKLQLTGILYLTLMACVIYFFISSNRLVKEASTSQRELNTLSNDIRSAELALADYVHDRLTIDQLNQQLEALEKRLAGNTVADELTHIREALKNYSRLKQENQAIENDITGLTDTSVSASNNFIKELSDRLIGKETRAGVSDMERAVIFGANMNTTANFNIKVLFGRLKADIGRKDEMLQFLDTLVANVTKDIELLKGTENEAMARKAKAANLQIKKLVLEYIQNVNELNSIEADIDQTIAKIDETISEHIIAGSSNVFATIKGYFTTIIGVVLSVSIIGILVNFWLATTISGSLNQLIHLVKDLAEGDGDLTKRITVVGKDETGDLAQWINLFVEKLHTIIKEVSQNADALNHSSNELTTISQEMSEGASQASMKSNNVATASEEMNVTMTSVAAASEEAATNVSMVASASEEMAITVKEIAKNSEKARSVTNDAVQKAQGATANISKLDEAADQISKVTEVITEISEQTNLLALNATIEAARAGEAGKGFAVVANEIKELAKQTAEATQEIKARIDGIQQSSLQTVDQITVISRVIKDVDEIVSTIAASVEEQAVTTQEIAGNVAQASAGINEVNQNMAQSSNVSTHIAQEIAEVNEAAGMLANSGSQVNMSSEALAELSQKLHQTVKRFKL